MLLLLSKLPVGSGRVSYCVDGIGQVATKNYTNAKKNIQEIWQEQDPGPDKALAKSQAGPRENRNTVKFCIKVSCIWGKKKKIKSPQNKIKTHKQFYLENSLNAGVHISFFTS